MLGGGAGSRTRVQRLSKTTSFTRLVSYLNSDKLKPCIRVPLVLYPEKQENLPSFFNEALGTPDYAASA